MENIASPCVRNCCLNDEEICLGCFRSLEEIVGWSKSSEQQKQAIVGRAKARKAEHRFEFGEEGEKQTIKAK